MSLIGKHLLLNLSLLGLLSSSAYAQVEIKPATNQLNNPVINGVMSAPDGTCAAPSYTFTSGTGTGLAKSGNNLLECAGGSSVGAFGNASFLQLMVVSGARIGFTNSSTDPSTAATGDIYFTRTGAGQIGINQDSTHGISLFVGTDGTAWFQTRAAVDAATLKSNTLVTTSSTILTSATSGSIAWTSSGFFGSSSNGVYFFEKSDGTGVALTTSGDGKFLFGNRPSGTAASQVAVTQTTAPTCTAANNCGTGNGTFATGSSDTAGSVTLGTTPASGFIITFNGTWAAAPTCTVWMNKAGMVVGKQVLTSVTSTTTITVVTNGTAPATGDIYAYHCIGIQ